MILFFWVVDLIIPVTMISIGTAFIYGHPKKVNSLSGYRTSMSMKSKETWRYAHNLCGWLWLFTGIVLLIGTIVSKILSQLPIETLSLIHVGFGLLALIYPIIIVEIGLRKNFDKDGNPK